MSTAGSAGTDHARIGRRPSTSHAKLAAVAFELFLANGFDETSVDDIAGAAGIGRRTFFRYYPSKTDLVWGDFTAQLEGMRARLVAVPASVPMMDAVHQAVVDFNRIPPEQEAFHRHRLGLILRSPALVADSTHRFAEWRAVIAEFAASRLELRPDELMPGVVGYSALGAALAAYEQWLRDDRSDLAGLLDDALGELASGFSRTARRLDARHETSWSLDHGE